jgi:hypothetical protein
MNKTKRLRFVSGISSPRTSGKKNTTIFKNGRWLNVTKSCSKKNVCTENVLYESNCVVASHAASIIIALMIEQQAPLKHQ